MPSPLATPPAAPSGAPTPDALPRLAAIDVGTNSIRLVVAEVEPDGGYRVLDEEREMTRLGHRLFDTGRLDGAAMEHALKTLATMRAIVDGFGVAAFRAVATSAVREASNGPAFCRQALRRCGVRIEVISAEEEAQLVVQSAQRHFDLAGRAVAIADIGGGSLELVFAAGGVVERVYTFPLGAVRLTERYLRSDPPTRREWKKLRRAIDRALDAALTKVPFRPELMIGSGGTFTNLGEMGRAERHGEAGSIHGYRLSRSEVVEQMQRLRVMPLERRRETPGLNPRRADIIVAGVAAVSRLAKRLGTQQIVVNERGVRDGLLLTMLAERTTAVRAPIPTLDRLGRVRAFAQACRSNQRHCEHVGLLAGQLFDQLQERGELPAESRDLLVAAALLHDIGYLVNHAQHHKHAYHLIMHASLDGFAPQEIELIANIARYHRRALPKKRHANFARLDRADRRLVRRLSGILRVADGLDRTHSGRVTGVRCEFERGGVRVLVEADSDPQVEIWDAERKAVLFAAAFDLTPHFEWQRHAEQARPRLVAGGRGRRRSASGAAR